MPIAYTTIYNFSFGVEQVVDTIDIFQYKQDMDKIDDGYVEVS